MQSFALNLVGPNSFAIVPASVTTNGAQFRFDFTASVWASVRVNFWASANSDVQVGFIDACTFMLIQPASSTAPSAQTAQLSPAL
jgi:hypothetical protein